MAAVSVEEVSRSYGDTVALDSVSLAIDRGETFCLVGPNGAGKTTLVRAITGTTDAEGTVELFGDHPRNVDRERIGLLPQDFSPPDRLTARELLAYFAGLYDDHRPVDAVLGDVGLSGTEDTYYENLSGGQQRRTCVAIALVNDPDLLVLDEPTTGIDPAGRRRLWDVLEDLADAGTTIVITTHYMEEAERLGDRVGLLADGSLVACDTPAALVAEYGGTSWLAVEGTFGGDVPDSLTRPSTIEDGRLLVEDVSPGDIGTITAEIETAGGAIDSLTWKEPDLEDVYLALADRPTTNGLSTARPRRGTESGISGGKGEPAVGRADAGTEASTGGEGQ